MISELTESGMWQEHRKPSVSSKGGKGAKHPPFLPCSRMCPGINSFEVLNPPAPLLFNPGEH